VLQAQLDQAFGGDPTVRFRLEDACHEHIVRNALFRREDMTLEVRFQSGIDLRTGLPLRIGEMLGAYGQGQHQGKDKQEAQLDDVFHGDQ
jgi:hypothetical protein